MTARPHGTRNPDLKFVTPTGSRKKLALAALSLVTLSCSPQRLVQKIMATPTPIPWAFQTEHETTDIKYAFFPARQVVHRPFAPRLEIYDPHPDKPGTQKFKIFFNKLDVTRHILPRVKILQNPQTGTLTLRFPELQLPDDSSNTIAVAYQNQRGQTAWARLQPPSCLVSELSPILTVESHNADEPLLNLIVKHARLNHVNPALFVALVAQESGFNPRAVSWAKAVGLTQVTPVAEVEIVQEFPHFPRYPGLNSSSVPWIKTLIAIGRANERNEWRLHRERSVVGGVRYFRQLSKYWASPRNLARIQKHFPNDAERTHAELVLASYNGGFVRVSSALSRRGKRWLDAPELGEARRYVRRIESLCYHFSQIDEGSPRSIANTSPSQVTIPW